MKLIQPTHEEQVAWDTLVKQHQGSVFSESRYLNALDLNWCILYNEEKTGGMVCPFAVKAKQRFLINPIYHQYTEWIGEGNIDSSVIDFLKKDFNIAELNVKGIVENTIQLVHQVISSNNFKLNALAKRSLKKSLNYKISLNKDISSIKHLVLNELTPKISGMTVANLKNLEQLVEAFSSNGLRSYCAYENERFVGGIWVLENETDFMYLKGTAEPEAKKNGAMYLLMQTAITDCLKENKIFDFGGSNVPTVQRFNYNMGGTDRQYSQLKWNRAPFWWNILRSMKKKFTR